MLLPIAGRWFASFAGAGSIAGWTYATKLFELPLQVLITVFATALFPRFSQLLAHGNETAAKHFLQLGGQVVLVCATAVAVVAAWFAVDLVQLAFRLPAADGAVVAGLVQVLLIGLPFAGLTALLQAWYAASRDTRTPLIVGIIGVGCFLAAGWPVLRSGGLVGLAWLAAGHYALGCGLLIHRGLLSWRVLVPSTIAASVALGLCLLSPLIDGSILRLVLAAVAGSVAVAAGLTAIPGLRQFANR